MKTFEIAFSPEARIQINSFLRGIGGGQDVAVCFNFARSVSPSSALGRAIAEGADEDITKGIAEQNWRGAVGPGWTLELVSYERNRLDSKEVHNIEGVFTYIPRDLEVLFQGKVVDFQNNEFILR